MNSPLNDEEFEELAERLDPEKLGNQSMDLIETHGLFTALAVGPALPPEEAWLPLVLGDEPNFDTPGERERMVELLHHFLAEVDFVLSDGEPVNLPFEPTLGDDPAQSDMRAWCVAFMEGHLLTEEKWFETSEDEVGELLLPLAALSGMLEEEFSDLDQDEALVNQLAKQLPETVTDLYLLFRVPPEERTAPPPPPKKPRGGGGKNNQRKKKKR